MTTVDTDALPGIGLAELVAGASLQARQDRKYVVTAPTLVAVLDELADRLAVLEIEGERGCTYTTTYYDTDDRLCYRQHVQEVRRRFKARTRTYVGSGLIRLELKAKGPGGHTVKHALDGAAAELDDDGRAFLRTALDDSYGAAYAPWVVPALQEALRMTCRRTTLSGLAEQVRVTADTGLLLGGQQLRAGLVLLEVKSAGPRTDVDRVLVRHGARPTSFSKYVAAAELDPAVVPRPRKHPARLLHRCFVRCDDEQAA